MNKIIISAPTKEKLVKRINEYFFSKNYAIGYDNIIVNTKRTPREMETMNRNYHIEELKKGGWVLIDNND